MEIVEVWRETQTLDRAVDVRLDVLGRIGDSAVFESGEAALGCDYVDGQQVDTIEIVS